METQMDASRDNKLSRLFCLGQIVATPGALKAMEESEQNLADFIGRHLLGDWGELCEEDRQSNEEALLEGLRLMSVYRTDSGEKIWVITEATRSATTVLLPSEY